MNKKSKSLDEIIKEIIKLPRKEYLKFLYRWHGEQYLWDIFIEQINTIKNDKDEGEKEAIKMIKEYYKN